MPTNHSAVDQFLGLAQFAIYIALTFAALWLIVKIFPSIGEWLSALADAFDGVSENRETPAQQHAFHRPEKNLDRYI